MLKYLQQPFPFTGQYHKRLRSSFSISLFVFLFLYVFRPFGLNGINTGMPAIALGYGLVTLAITLIVNVYLPRLFPNIFCEEKWNLYKEIIFIMLVIMLIGCGNLIYTAWLGFTSLHFVSFVYFEFYTLVVAFFPVSLTIMAKQNILLRKNISAAKKLSEGLSHKERLLSKMGEQVTIDAENPNDNFIIEAKNIICIKSADNYVEVYFNSTQTKRKLIRTTLRNAQSNLKMFSQFYRCHRAYIVNLEKVKKVSGNAQGYRLILDGLEEEIPVSRTLNKEITLRLGR